MYHQQQHHHHHHQQPPAAQQKHSTSTSTSTMHFHKRHRHSHSHSHSNVRNHAGALFVQLVVLIVCIVLACPCCVFGQYGFDLPGYPNSYYTSERFNVNNPNVKADRYDSFANATLADERLDEIAKELKLNYPSLVYIRDDLWSSGVSNGFTYERYELNGFGPLWQILCGQPTLYIDLTRNETELHDMGVEFVSDNHTVSFSLEYVSEIDEEESIHAHGILGGHWTDGVPFLNTAPLKRDQKTKIVYNINPKTNSGTYFLHSHYGFNALHGVGAPLIIQSAVDALYPNASIVNNANTQELIFYAEDWCLVYSNADDVDTEGDDYTDAHDVRDPAICQNPFLTLRALYGEWNTFKGKAVLDGPNPELRQCLDPVPAPEFGSAFFLVNDRSANDARLQQVTANTSARLRVINAARMTNFLLKVPDSLAGEIIAVDGSYIVPVKMSDLNNEVWVGVAQRVDILLTIPAKPDVFPIIAVQEMPAPTDGEKLRPFSISLSAGLILYSTDILPPQNLIPQKVNGTGMLAHHPEWIKNQERKFTAWPPLKDKVWQSATQIQVALTGYNGIFGMNFLRGLEFPPVMMSEEAFVQSIKDMAPLAVVKQNDLVCINMTNYSWDTHPMHLHGHHFQVVDMDGEPFSGAIRDTVLVPAGKCHSVNICFEAFHRAGQFGLHCHMAIHEMAGMFGIIRYGEGTPLVGLKAEKSDVSDDESAAAARVGVGVGVPLGLLLLLSFLLNVYFVYKRHSEARGRYERVNPVKNNFTMPAGAGADADGDGDGDEEEFETKSAAEGIAMVDMNSDDT